jgi:heparosan-N-sulfate-glucuronate 5-epimerase
MNRLMPGNETRTTTAFQKTENNDTGDRLLQLMNVHILNRGTSRKIWSYPALINSSRLISSSLLDGYYLDFSRDADYLGPKDRDGILLVDYTGKVGVQYNPFFIGYYALACYERFRKTNIQQYIDTFLRQANWLLRHAVYRGKDMAVWEYTFPWMRRMSPPWISSLSQSIAISVLLRAWLLTGRGQYFDIATSAANALFSEIDRGGVMYKKNGMITFEEYPSQPPHTVLNGFIFSIWGAVEFSALTGAHTARYFVERSIHTLAEILPAYDLGFWSKYQLEPQKEVVPWIASPFYHNLHVAQLTVMDSLFHNTVFEEFASRWRSYEKSWTRRLSAFFFKSIHKLFFE